MWCRDIYIPGIQPRPNILDTSHTKYGQYLSQEYDCAFQDIMKGNACLYLPRTTQNWMTISQCEAIMDGISKHGLLALLSEYFSRVLEDTDYYAYLNKTYPPNNYNQMYIDVVNNPRLIGLQRLYRGLAFPLMRYLKDILISNINSSIDGYNWTLFISMVIFVCCLAAYQVVVTLFIIVENERVSSENMYSFVCWTSSSQCFRVPSLRRTAK